jgi:hypothetical protein
MLGGVPFNYATVIWAMNAVYQSNVNGTVRNTPFGGDEANTETLPAYILSTWLFENEMRNGTGYWITGLVNTNVTAIAYSGDTLLIQAVGGTGSSLAIANDTWNYTYTVRGFETIRLTITHLSVGISPVSVVMDAGQSQLFASKVSGGVSPYTYQWYLNDSAVSGANSSTWVYTPTETGSHLVFVKINDSVGTQAMSNTSNIEVNERPRVTVSLSSAILDVNQFVTLNSTVSGGTSPYSFQWYLNDTAVSGASDSTLTYRPTSAGSYTIYLRVTDSATPTAYTVASNNATVTVNAPPLVAVFPNLTTLDVGQSKIFYSMINGGTPPYKYQWYLNGAPVSNATSSSWTFTPTSSGSYMVYFNATDNVEFQMKSNIASVTVNSAPSVTISPTSSSLDVGQSQTFNSTVSGGTSPYSYQWYLNGSAVAGASGSSWTCTFNSPGFYTVNVVVIDTVGVSATSSLVTVTVKTPVSVTAMIEIIIAIIEAVVVATFLVMLRKRKRQ